MANRNPKPRKYSDPFDRERHHPFLMQRAQANFRGETWYLTFEEWGTFWNATTWPQRGRHSDNLCMTRIDYNEAWAVGNVQIIPRHEQIRTANQRPDRRQRGPTKNKKDAV